jgi:RHS repeat-associated protein
VSRDATTGGTSQIVTAQRVVFLCDANYNITALIRASGQVVERYAYNAYGKATIYTPDWSATRSQSSVANTVLYTGQQRDPATGLYDYRARWYNPSTGGFVSRDPAGFAAGDANLYRYVRNRPTGRVDPSGLESISAGDLFPDGRRSVVPSEWRQIGGEVQVGNGTVSHWEIGPDGIGVRVEHTTVDGSFWGNGSYGLDGNWEGNIGFGSPGWMSEFWINNHGQSVSEIQLQNVDMIFTQDRKKWEFTSHAQYNDVTFDLISNNDSFKLVSRMDKDWLITNESNLYFQTILRFGVSTQIDQREAFERRFGVKFRIDAEGKSGPWQWEIGTGGQWIQDPDRKPGNLQWNGIEFIIRR